MSVSLEFVRRCFSYNPTFAVDLGGISNFEDKSLLPKGVFCRIRNDEHGSFPIEAGDPMVEQMEILPKKLALAQVGIFWAAGLLLLFMGIYLATGYLEVVRGQPIRLDDRRPVSSVSNPLDDSVIGVSPDIMSK
jgi:hypothetical protein